MGKPNQRHGDIQACIIFALKAFVDPRGLGRVVGEARFLLRLPEEAELKERAPDVAFIAKEPGAKTGTLAYKPEGVGPDLAIEIASPGQFRPEMEKTAKEYMLAGTREVWIVYPHRHEMDIWRPGQARQTLKAGQQIEGKDLFPGFIQPLVDFFPDLLYQRQANPPQHD